MVEQLGETQHIVEGSIENEKERKERKMRCPECGKVISKRFPFHECFKVRFTCSDCGESRVEEVYQMPEKTEILCNRCAGKRTLTKIEKCLYAKEVLK